MNKSSFSDGPVFFLYQQQGFLASVTHFHNNDLLRDRPFSTYYKFSPLDNRYLLCHSNIIFWGPWDLGCSQQDCHLSLTAKDILSLESICDSLLLSSELISQYVSYTFSSFIIIKPGCTWNSALLKIFVIVLNFSQSSSAE